MGRRRNSTADDFIDLVAMMPWYAGVILAVVSYVILSGIAASSAPTNPGAAIWHMLAQVGRMVVPFFCLIGAAASAWRRFERRKLVDGVAGSTDAASLNAMTWRQFEKLVGEGFRLQGYSVVENETAGPDGGVDLVLRKDGEKVFVQCKQWRSIKGRRVGGARAARDRSRAIPDRSAPVLCRFIGPLCHSVPKQMTTPLAPQNDVIARGV